MDTQELQKIKNRFDIIGNDAALNLALEMAVTVAPSDLTVLITGESGVGKDVIPQIIHQGSRRRNGKYLAINCGSIPSGTISAELFGSVKGSYTGSIADRKGYFEEADGGTIFLDEIAELPKDTQAMLLRVLQTGEYIKVGSSKVEKTDVRVIAATNANLLHNVGTGKFREDLYYRLNAIQIKMPALRERKDDIYLLFRKFTSDFSEKSGLCKISLTHEAISLLKNYRWPGNIRQLKNFTEAVTALESQSVTPSVERMELDADAIRKHLPQEEDTLLPSVASPASRGSMSDDEKRAIVKALLDLKNEVDRQKAEIVRLKDIIGAAASQVPVNPIGPAADDDVDEVDWEESDGLNSGAVSLKKAGDDLIFRTLEKYNRNVKQAAAELGISERTIYRKIAGQKKV